MKTIDDYLEEEANWLRHEFSDNGITRDVGEKIIARKIELSKHQKTELVDSAPEISEEVLIDGDNYFLPEIEQWKKDMKS